MNHSPLKVSSAHRLSSDSGATLVEFAISLGVLMLFILGAFDFSLMITKRTLLSESLRTAAAAVLVSETNCGNIALAKFSSQLDKYPFRTTNGTGTFEGERKELIKNNYDYAVYTIKATAPLNFLFSTFFRQNITIGQKVIIPLQRYDFCPSVIPFQGSF